MRALRAVVALLAQVALAAPASSAVPETSTADQELSHIKQQLNDTLWLEQNESNGRNGSGGFNLLYLIPILVGTLLLIALTAWVIVRKCRDKKKMLKRSESALLPIVDPNALLLSPDSRNYYLQDEAETNRQLGEQQDSIDFGSTLRTSESLMMSLRFDSTTRGGGGVIESFQSARGGGGSSVPLVVPTSSGGLLDSFHNKNKNQSQGITDAQSTQLYRMLHADPNVSSHRLAYQKIAFERMLSSRSSPSGSPSKTWLCQYEGEEIAVKVLQHHFSATASMRKMKSGAASPSGNEPESGYEDLRRLVDEIQLTASLEHPNVVRFLAVAWDSMAIESLCLITEYLPGGNLQDHLQVTRYPDWTHRKLRFAIGVANALQYLHSRKASALSSSSSSSSATNSSAAIAASTATILHRDVRAKNVGLSHTFEPKLVNIGAKHDYLSYSPELVAAGDGNAFWTAPEVLSGRRYSEKSDIYAFGVLLSEIDTNGTLPYANATNSMDNKQQQSLRPFQVLNLVASGKLRPAFAPNCPARIREIAAMCLCNDPAQRVNAATLTQLLESYDKTLAQ